jgi:vanillate O-demethylase ferredoxin subunit
MGAGALSALFLLGGVGAFLWWPRKPRRLVQGFILDRRLKGPAFTLGLHRTAGGWIAIVLCVSAITGIPNAYDSVKNGLTALGGAPEPKVHSAPPADKRAPHLPLAAAWRTITSLTPNPREVLIHVARKPKAPLEIFVIEANAPHANARTYLYLDGYSGKVLRFAPYSRSGFGSRLYYWMLSLHTGEVGGVFGQLLLFLGALGVPVLAYTGVKSYLGRELRKRAQRAGSRAPAGKAQRA